MNRRTTKAPPTSPSAKMSLMVSLVLLLAVVAVLVTEHSLEGDDGQTHAVTDEADLGVALVAHAHKYINREPVSRGYL